MGGLEEGAALSAGVSVPPAMLRLAQGLGGALGLQIMRRAMSGAPHVTWSSSRANPQWHRDPCLALALHVMAQGEHQADRPLSQPQDTGLFHYWRPPTLCHGLLAALLVWGGGSWQRGQEWPQGYVFAACCEQHWGCPAAPGRGEILSILPVSPNRGHGARGSSLWGFQRYTVCLDRSLNPGAPAAWRDLSVFCYGESEALGVGNQGRHSHVTILALSPCPCV